MPLHPLLLLLFLLFLDNNLTLQFTKEICCTIILKIFVFWSQAFLLLYLSWHWMFLETSFITITAFFFLFAESLARHDGSHVVIGDRICFEGYYATVRYIGSVPPQEGKPTFFISDFLLHPCIAQMAGGYDSIAICIAHCHWILLYVCLLVKRTHQKITWWMLGPSFLTELCQ